MSLYKNLVETFDDVATPIHKRLDRAFKEYKKTKVQSAHMPIIPGVDTTDSGRYLTFEQHDKNLKRQGNIITHTEVLRTTFAHVPCTIMPWETLQALCKELKVMIIYPQENNSITYTIPKAWRDSVEQKVFEIDEKIRDCKSKINPPEAIAVITFFGVFGFSVLFTLFAQLVSVDIGAGKIMLLGIIIIAGGMAGFNYLMQRTIKQLRVDKESIISKYSNLLDFFPDGIIQNADDDDGWSRDYVNVKIPKQPPHITDKINKTFAPHHLKDFLASSITTVLTVADVNAIGMNQNIKPFAELQPVQRVTPAKDYDPGIVVRYGTMVAILSDLFWNLTDVEEDFYDSAMQIGRSFDVQRYIYN